MPDSRLQERLRNLRRASVSSPDPPREDGRQEPDALPRLERSMLGEAGEGLTLKQRLERLVAAAGARERARLTAPHRPLETLVPAREIENERGRFLLVEESRALDAMHGDVTLSRLQAIAPRSVHVLSGDRDHADFDLSRAVFVDTETTGLAGGSGTAAFLVGLGFIEDGRFVVRQYFMRDYDEEPALLHALIDDLARFSDLVTFNGKMFDIPLLETRFRMNRARFPLEIARHLDLLHPARRLWKARLESCRLKTLESALLGVTRVGDIPGEAIPQAYFSYVRDREGGMMSRVFEHNRLDIVSLAALSALACQWIEEGRAEDPRDVLSLARVLERAELYERSEDEYRRVVASGNDIDAGHVRLSALVRLARRRKRSGDGPGAAALWEAAAREGFIPAFRELAVYHEHARRDPETALLAVEEGLARLGGSRVGTSTVMSRDLNARRERLRRKVGDCAASRAPRRKNPQLR